MYLSIPVTLRNQQENFQGSYQMSILTNHLPFKCLIILIALEETLFSFSKQLLGVYSL